MINKLNNLLFIFLIFLSFNLLAESENTQSTAKSETQEEEHIEVIEVTGQFPIGWYREQIHVKRKEFYDAVNLLIDDEEFHVICGRVDHSKSIFEYKQVADKKRSCEPNFKDNLMMKSKNVSMAAGASGVVANIAMDRMEFRRRYNKKVKEYHSLVKSILQNSPELIERLQSISDAELSYKRSHVEKFGKWSKYAQEILEKSDD